MDYYQQMATLLGTEKPKFWTPDDDACTCTASSRDASTITLEKLQKDVAAFKESGKDLIKRVAVHPSQVELMKRHLKIVPARLGDSLLGIQIDEDEKLFPTVVRFTYGDDRVELMCMVTGMKWQTQPKNEVPE